MLQKTDMSKKSLHAKKAKKNMIYIEFKKMRHVVGNLTIKRKSVKLWEILAKGYVFDTKFSTKSVKFWV